MRLIDIAQSIRDAWDVLFPVKPTKPNEYVIHLEGEIKYLREQNQILSTKLDIARMKDQAPQQVVRRDPPKLTAPQKTKWDQYVEEDMARQEREAAEAVPKMKEQDGVQE